MEQLSPNEWIADIFDNTLHSMTLLIGDDRELIHWSCECKYDRNSICRHIAAFILQVRKEWAKEELLCSLLNIEPPPPPARSYAENAAAYSMEVRKIIRGTKAERKAVPPGEIAAQLAPLIAHAEELISKDTDEEALALIFQVFKQAGEYYEEFEDPDYSLAERCRAAGVLLSSIMERLPVKALPKQLQDELVKLVAVGNYADFSLADIPSMIESLARRTGNYKHIIKLINDLLKDMHDPQRVLPILHCLISLLRMAGQEADIPALVDKHLYIPDIRRIKLDYLLAEEAYEEAIELLSEGVALLVGRYLAREGLWMEEELFALYRKTGDTDNMIKTAARLIALGEDGRKYCRQVRACLPPDSQDNAATLICSHIDIESNRRLIPPIIDLYIAEEQWDSLLNLVTSSIRISETSLLDLCADQLCEHRPEGMYKYYTEHLLTRMQIPTNKDSYTFIINTLERIKAIEKEGDNMFDTLFALLVVMNSRRYNRMPPERKYTIRPITMPPEDLFS
jgi:tetratricopeptide (TPR) repeat protein